MIRTEHLSFSYGGKAVLEGIDFAVNNGEFVAIIGPNGAGKSTLLKLLDRILVPRQGEIYLNGEALRSIPNKRLARLVGFVPQNFSIAFDYTVREIVEMGRFPFSSFLSNEDQDGPEAVQKAMRSTDILPLRNRSLSTLSGGEKQRVVLASALAQEPRILLLDEPTAALDIRHQAHFFEILRELRRQRSLTILFVTHDVNLATRFCDRIIVLKEGRIWGDGPAEKIVSAELMEEIYETPIQILQHPVDGKPVLLLSGKTGKGNDSHEKGRV